MTSSLHEAFLSHRGRTFGILGVILVSLGASWGHLGHMWGHLGMHSAIWEVWLHVLKLATLKRASRSNAKTGLSSYIFKAFRGSKIAFSLGTCAKNGKMAVSARCCDPSSGQLGHLRATWAHLGAILGDLGAILGHLGPS